MDFSDLVPNTLHAKFASNSQFFIYYEGKKIYIKQCSVNLKNHSVISLAFNPSDVLISPDSNLIAVLYKQKSTVIIYSIDTTVKAKIEDPQAGISGIAWAPDSYQLLVFSDLLYKCSIYNISDKSISYLRSPKLPNYKGVSFSSNGKLMALLQKHDNKDSIGIYFCGDWKMVNSIVLDSFDVVELRWAQNDSFIAAWQNPINYRFYAVCPYKGVTLRYQAYDLALGIKNVASSSKCQFVAIGSYDEKIRLINSLTWKYICDLDCSNPIIQSEDTKIYKEDDSIKNIDRMKLVSRSQFKIPTKNGLAGDKNSAQGIGLLEFSHNDQFLACRNDSMSFTVWIWDISSLQVEAIISLNTSIKMLKWDKNENTLCIVCGTDKVLFWKKGVIFECVFPIQNRKFNIQRFMWSNDCNKMLLFDKTDFIYADLVNISD